MTEDSSPSAIPTMKTRINQILDGLTDELNVQPIVYELFESCDPEDVKKTIESLQRALEYKNEEVKKHLSMNHGHLFSCTDLIEQLRQFVKMSKTNVENIKRINLMVGKDDPEDDTLATDSTEKNTYDVHWFTFLQEVSFGVQQIMERRPIIAVEGFLAIIDQFKENKESIQNIKVLWLNLLTQSAQSLKASLQFGKEISQDLVSAFCCLLSLPFKPESEEIPFTFSKLQAISQVSKQLEIKSPVSLLKVTDADSLLYTLMESYLESHESLDIIEVLKLTQFIDNRSTINFIAGHSQAHSILSEIYNRRSQLLKSASYMHCGKGVELQPVESVD